MFIAISKYIKPMSEIDALRPAHLAFLKKLISENKVIMAGRQNPVTGGIIIAKMDSQLELEKVLSEDPFSKAGIAEYQIIEFNPAVYHEQLKEFCV
ncbi:MAG: YciI family protein [Gammaproteobacteria bacterium]|nr:YciI family protein [Gammaproteobacteria bacterium]